MKLLIHARTGKTYITERQSFNTEFGLVRVEDGEQRSSTGEPFLVTDPWFVDMWHRIRRGPQITHWKDLGLLAALTGLGPGWRVVEAGSGSGFATCFFAHIVGPSGHVYSYEKNPRFLRIARENAERCGLSNVTFHDRPVEEGITEKDVHLVFLDLPEPWHAFHHAAAALRPAGFLALYLPSVEQVKMAVEALPDAFAPFSVHEVIYRRWKAGDVTRPENTGLLHTAFLLITRKVREE